MPSASCFNFKRNDRIHSICFSKNQIFLVQLRLKLKQDAEGIQNMSGVYMIVLDFIKWKQFLTLFNVIICHFRIEKKKRKILKDRFQINVSININALFSRSKITMKIKNKSSKNQIQHEVPYHLNKVVSKIG